MRIAFWIVAVLSFLLALSYFVFPTPTHSVVSSTDIDNITSEITSVLTESATQSGMLKDEKSVPRSNTKSKKRRKVNSQPWYDESCEQKRKLFVDARNKARRFASSKLAK